MITAMTYLMYKEGGSYKKLIDISDFPNMGGAPEMYDKTSLSNTMEVNELGIIKMEALEFTAFYEDEEDLDKLIEMKGKEQEFALWLGGTDNGDGTTTPTGDKGKWEWKGKLSAYLEGKGTKTNHTIKITISNSTEIVKKKKGDQ